MDILIGFLLVFLIIFVALAAFLAIEFIRLSKELQKIEENRESIVRRLGRLTRIVRLAVPVVTLARRANPLRLKSLKKKFKKE